MITIGRGTPILCLNATGKAIDLPVDYLYRSLCDGRKLSTIHGEPLVIERLGYRELVTVKTNYSSWHELTVGEETELARWRDGAEVVDAGKCAKQQLLGVYGMYVVTQTSRTLIDAYRCNAATIGGVYVGATNGRRG